MIWVLTIYKYNNNVLFKIYLELEDMAASTQKTVGG